jgi:hypothetical protein
MSDLLGITITVAVIFLPFAGMLVVRARFQSRIVRFPFAVIFALASGWLACHLASDFGWKPRLKGGHVVGLSPLGLAGAFASGHFIALLFFVFSKDVATGRTASVAPDWRVGHVGRDMMYYEEARDGRWERIEISGEMLIGPAHHVIYFDTAEAWEKRVPDWARGRRNEIISRIKSAFRPPGYEYHGA